MSLDALYPKALLRLAADAHGAGRLPAPDITVTRVNPLCGDKITLDLRVADRRITALGHEAKACVICQASAARLSQIAVGQARTDAAKLRAAIAEMLKGGAVAPAYRDFASVTAQKSRHTCVLLPLDALIEGLSAS